MKGDEARPTTGLSPLTDLGDARYLGAPGGLYPNGQNERPKAHEAAGLARAAQVVPRALSGEPDEGGSMALISIGMSHTALEFSHFAELAAADDRTHPRLAFVNAAKKTVDAVRAANPADPYWSFVAHAVAASGHSPEQVQAAWLKSAVAAESRAFPDDAEHLTSCLVAIVKNLRVRFPNLAIVYVSSRSFGGYSTPRARVSPEPTAYHTGFAVKWLIARQIEGDSELDRTTAPFLSWGPYLWADGKRARADGVTWAREDFAADGAHLSERGAARAARLLLHFFLDDTTAAPWFRR